MAAVRMALVALEAQTSTAARPMAAHTDRAAALVAELTMVALNSSSNSSSVAAAGEETTISGVAAAAAGVIELGRIPGRHDNHLDVCVPEVIPGFLFCEDQGQHHLPLISASPLFTS